MNFYFRFSRLDHRDLDERTTIPEVVSDWLVRRILVVLCYDDNCRLWRSSTENCRWPTLLGDVDTDGNRFVLGSHCHVCEPDARDQPSGYTYDGWQESRLHATSDLRSMCTLFFVRNLLQGQSCISVKNQLPR